MNKWCLNSIYGRVEIRQWSIKLWKTNNLAENTCSLAPYLFIGHQFPINSDFQTASLGLTVPQSIRFMYFHLLTSLMINENLQLNSWNMLIFSGLHICLLHLGYSNYCSNSNNNHSHIHWEIPKAILGSLHRSLFFFFLVPHWRIQGLDY